MHQLKKFDLAHQTVSPRERVVSGHETKGSGCMYKIHVCVYSGVCVRSAVICVLVTWCVCDALPNTLTSWCNAVDIRQQLTLGHAWVSHQQDVDVPCTERAC